MEYTIVKLRTVEPENPLCSKYNEYGIIGIPDRVFSAKGSSDVVAIDSAHRYVENILKGTWNGV